MRRRHLNCFYCKRQIKADAVYAGTTIDGGFQSHPFCGPGCREDQVAIWLNEKENESMLKKRETYRFALARFAVLLLLLAAWTNAHAVDAVITFTDNANNETGFRVERNLNGGAFTTVATVAPATAPEPSVVQLIDTTLVASQTVVNKYCFRTAAFNTAGSSPFATTATPGVTDCKTVPTIITIPTAPSGQLVQ